ncbi:DNA internalization-related competence protein ComEC/Rec2 [Nocardioides anomalus]|uniref:DNA internalization-related competence protein ComEC/Rec2 n=2 Tax=Nocardioides anomalus TaxID=2712223 RepID=A0A6G6WKQ3_9ACTN|nr:DNA internalization-related competence protein ComEC/Rec2 [Nocardioides anomalus]
MPLLGAAAWLGSLAASLTTGRVLAAVLISSAAAGATLAVRRRAARVAVAALLLVALAAAGVTAFRAERTAHNPVAVLAGEGAAVTVVGTVASDPHTVQGGFADQVVWRLAVGRVTGRGQTLELRAQVLVLAGADRARPALGAQVEVHGRLVTADDDREVSALLKASGDPRTSRRPDVWWRGAGAVRQALRDSVARRPADQRALVPALVDGDDAAVDPELQEAFRTTGLTHLLAVSGTNLTLVVGFLLVLARWAGVRGRWLHLVAAAGIVGFVLMARTEPSVLRAAVMGSIGLLAMGTAGRHKALRALGGSVVVLVLLDPTLAVSAGFALSVLATGGILLLAPAWRDALGRWLPRWLAEAVAVPAAAQLACTPLVAALSGQVSLVAVVANLLVAPVVGPATVLGLAGGLLTLVWAPVGQVAGTLASWCVAWVITVAEHGAALPTAAIGWGTGPVALAALTASTVAIALVGPRLLRNPITSLVLAALLVVAVLARPPRLGWPPDGWLLVACDVGQGDALAVAAGPHTAVVIDAGPDARAVDRCLDRLGVERVPVAVLTHFHADHVDGIEGALGGREVGGVWTTRLQDPPGGVREVVDAAAEAGVRPEEVAQGRTFAVGQARFQVLWPPADQAERGPGDGSTANEASVVLLVETGGLRLLLTGDIEPEGQQALARLWPGLEVDVLKLPHHGSAHQDEEWLRSLHARDVLVSVGADNDYGHPAASAMEPLERDGAALYRTDQDGDLAVVVDGGEPEVVTSR